MRHFKILKKHENREYFNWCRHYVVSFINPNSIPTENYYNIWEFLI